LPAATCSRTAEAASGFTETATGTWQGLQQPTPDSQVTTDASPRVVDLVNASDDSAIIDPWLAAFLGDNQSPQGSTTDHAIEKPPANSDDNALTALFGDVMARANMSSVSRINPAGVITKLLAGQVEAEAMSLNPAMSAFNEIQKYINSHAN
jgi:hypothetical protein